MKNLKLLLSRGESPDEVIAEPRQHEQCLSCGADLEGSKSYERFRVCHSCGFHFHLTARERMATLLDVGSFHEDDRGVTSIDPLSFRDKQSYRSRVINAQRRTGLTESALTGTGSIYGRDLVIAVIDFSFLGGSIGVAAGERLARAFEKATSRRVPVVVVCSTSGTRMQEGLLALMQGPRIAAAVQRHDRAGLPYIAVLTDPTTGSAYTGFVNLADMILSEPNALVGYAALRALQEAAGAELPEGAHTSEAHLRHGLIDAVVARPQLRDSLAQLLDLLMNDYRLTSQKERREGHTQHSLRTAWQQVQLSRHADRPTGADLVARMTTSFVALHGDRSGRDDASILAGIGSLAGEAVMFAAQVRSQGEHGRISAAGFRKARRAMYLAKKFELPVITLIDTDGADPSLDDEESGLGFAVAQCTAAMLELPVPTVAVIIGEANSEGAMAMAVADRVLMLDNAVYEVMRPEDAAMVLYGGASSASSAGEAAERLRLTSHDCLRLGIIDHTVPEPGDGAHTDHGETALILRRAVLRELSRIQRSRPKKRLEQRYARYRHIGSTRSWIRGRMERRLAHLTDRIGGFVTRVRDRSTMRKRYDYGDETDIPV